MNNKTRSIALWILTLSALCFAQKYPLPRDVVRITLADCTKIIDKVKYASPDELCLGPVFPESNESKKADRVYPWSVIRKMERFLGKEQHFFRNFFLGWAGTTLLFGLARAVTWEPCDETGFLACFMYPDSPGEAFAMGAYTGALVGVPVGLVTGIAISKSQWETLPLPRQNSAAHNSFVGVNLITDIDGNFYKTITIGSQTWMAENLRTTHYRNGDPIAGMGDECEWQNFTRGAWCTFENDSANAIVYGKLYNWYAVADPRNIAPSGWHIPTNDDWSILIDFLGGSSEAGAKLKAAGLDFWQTPNDGSTNESGFDLLPGGSRSITKGFVALGQSACLWSATDRDNSLAWSYMVQVNRNDISQQLSPKYAVFSVRCVKD